MPQAGSPIRSALRPSKEVEGGAMLLGDSSDFGEIFGRNNQEHLILLSTATKAFRERLGEIKSQMIEAREAFALKEDSIRDIHSSPQPRGHLGDEFRAKSRSNEAGLRREASPSKKRSEPLKRIAHSACVGEVISSFHPSSLEGFLGGLPNERERES